MQVHIDCFGLTDIGRKRAKNEDQFLIADLKKCMNIDRTSLSLSQESPLVGQPHGKLLVVADGMGGAAAGERASAIVVDTVARHVLNMSRWPLCLDEMVDERTFLDELDRVLQECNDAIAAEVQRAPHQRGMGTTLTAADIIWPMLYVVHVGDSRCYLVRGAAADQITRDQTVAQALLEGGALLRDPIEQSAMSHMLWSCIGGESDSMRPEIYKTRLEIGDTLVLCTDGLSKHVSNERIARTVGQCASAQESCERLVSHANEAGGDDNITVIVARFLQVSGSGERSEPQAVIAPLRRLGCNLFQSRNDHAMPSTQDGRTEVLPTFQSR